MLPVHMEHTMFVKTDGIVLRTVDYQDSDRLLTVFSRDLGKLSVRARGVRGNRNANRAACQLFAFSEFTLREYQGRYQLSESVLKESFHELQLDLERLSLASYFAQVVETVALENDPLPELLSLLLNSLFALSKLTLSQELVKAVFELRLACAAGFAPDLRGCVVCGNTQPDRLNISQGVLQCATCSGEEGIRMPLTPSVLAAMRYIEQAGPKKLFSFRLPEDGMRQLGELTESYLATRLERGFSTLDLYKSLRID